MSEKELSQEIKERFERLEAINQPTQSWRIEVVKRIEALEKELQEWKRLAPLEEALEQLVKRLSPEGGPVETKTLEARRSRWWTEFQTDEALTIHRQGFEPRHRTPQGDDTDVSERPMTDKMCPKCRASLGPEISNPKAPDSTLTALRPCPFCGWNPKSPQRPKKGPQPPKAGKSFSGS